MKTQISFCRTAGFLARLPEHFLAYGVAGKYHRRNIKNSRSPPRVHQRRVMCKLSGYSIIRTKMAGQVIKYLQTVRLDAFCIWISVFDSLNDENIPASLT